MTADLDPQVLEELSTGVRESLPEIALIEDPVLREQVVEVHARALAETRFKRIEDIPPTGVPDSPAMRQGTQADHYRATATMSIGLARGMQQVLPHVEIDYDVLAAAALTHDVGKAYEYEHWDRWEGDRARTGSPSLRHPAYGAHLALVVGLPEPVVHCVAVHSYLAEGAFVRASLETTIVQHADAAFWLMLDSGGHMEGHVDLDAVNRRA
jgi:HD-GYP domain-containing protein (c-di-GMP phosphodiesterase class II)